MHRRESMMGRQPAAFPQRRHSGARFRADLRFLSNGHPAGGSTDIASRRIIEGLAEDFDGCRMVVENRAGASGAVAGNAGFRAIAQCTGLKIVT